MKFDDTDFQNIDEVIENAAPEDDLVEEKEDGLVEKKEVDDWRDRFLRVTAEFENYKRRNAAEQIQWIQRSQQRLIVDILSIVDNFERALQQKNDQNAELFVGIEMIYKSFLSFLKKYNVEEIPTKGMFDPEKHEAIMQSESSDVASEHIIQTTQKGFMMHGEVIRHAQVIVAK
jgi:molecular chaperone GrpE